MNCPPSTGRQHTPDATPRSPLPLPLPSWHATALNAFNTLFVGRLIFALVSSSIHFILRYKGATFYQIFHFQMGVHFRPSGQRQSARAVIWTKYIASGEMFLLLKYLNETWGSSRLCFLSGILSHFREKQERRRDGRGHGRQLFICVASPEVKEAPLVEAGDGRGRADTGEQRGKYLPL